jgi:hypothetical protein
MIKDIWSSFRSLPAWVQIWVAFILAPVNMATLLFINQPGGLLVAGLANLAMMLNMPVMLRERGFSKLMGLPHLIPWTILVYILAFQRPAAEGLYDTFLTVLLITNTISLLFDYPDTLRWFQGDRAVAGRKA